MISPAILDSIRARAGAYALRQPFESVDITLGQLGIDAVALGAATLVINDLLAVETEPSEAPNQMPFVRSSDAVAGVA